MKSLVWLWLLVFSCVCSPLLGQTQFGKQPLPPPHQTPQQRFHHLDELLEGLNPEFLPEFIATYHRNNDTKQWAQLVTETQGGYFVLVAKMYLYGMLDRPERSELQQYVTEAPYLAAYFYLQVAAHQYSNSQAYYWLGLLEQFKLVPDRLLETHLGAKERDRAQDALYRHLKVSHLNNGEHNLFMAASLGHDPAALVLGHMNREAFGTSQNCTTALAYYLGVLKRTLSQPYSPKLVLDVSHSLQDQLYARKKLDLEEDREDNSFVMDTGYFDEETISATLEQANRFYVGSRGVLRDPERALRLFQKLSSQGNSDGKIMAGLMYFRGEGTPRDVGRARNYFEQTRKDEVSQYMLLVMDYFQMIGPATRVRAINTMRTKLKDDPTRKKLSHLLGFLIGAVALKGELNQVSHDDAVLMVDRAAAEGNPSARVLMAILFADGANGLKYGCGDATRYLSEDALYHSYFSKRTNTAEVALRQGFLPFAFFKDLELILNGFQTAYINGLYLLEIYRKSVLKLTPSSWQPSSLAQTPLYLLLRYHRLVPDIYTHLLQQYSPLGTQPLRINDLNLLLTGNDEYTKAQVGYIMKKIVKRGVVNEKRGVLRYYQYKLALAEGAPPKDIQNILSTLASGDSSKLYVLEARYLLGQLLHRQSLGEGGKMAFRNQTKVLGEYSRAVKSELLGKVIFQIEEWRLKGDFEFSLWETGMGQDFLAYIFVLAIGVFILYYLRAKRFDHFHKIELEKQLRRAHEQQIERQQAQEQQIERLQGLHHSDEINQGERADPDQPVIVEDLPKEPLQGVRIGSSDEEVQ